MTCPCHRRRLELLAVFMAGACLVAALVVMASAPQPELRCTTYYAQGAL